MRGKAEKMNTEDSSQKVQRLGLYLYLIVTVSHAPDRCLVLVVTGFLVWLDVERKESWKLCIRRSQNVENRKGLVQTQRAHVNRDKQTSILLRWAVDVVSAGCAGVGECECV